MFTKLKEICAHDESFFKTLTSMFEEQSPDLIKSVETACESESIEKIIEAAHTFKGVAINLGFEELAETCLKIEDRARDGKIDGYEELLGKVRSICEEISSEIAKI